MTEPPIVRPYREGDRIGVIRLWRCCFPDAPAHNDPDADIDRKAEVQPGLFLVAEIDRSVVGSAMAGYDGHRGWVYYVAVDPRHRRSGVGRILMEAVEEGLRRLGCPKLNLQVRAGNTAAAAFYRSLGYAVEERISLGKCLDPPGPTIV